MADRSSRLPSEQTPEGELADAITNLTKLLAKRPGPWWDVINCYDVNVKDIIANSNGQNFVLYIPIHSPNILTFTVTPYIDRLDIKLQLNMSIILWQKALFYELPQIGVVIEDG